eukprot:11229656-Prorocentrum_lima.AAC.1
MSVFCRAKGATDEYAVKSLLAFIDRLGWTHVRLHCDSEPSTIDLARAVKVRGAHMTTQTQSPR